MECKSLWVPPDGQACQPRGGPGYVPPADIATLPRVDDERRATQEGQRPRATGQVVGAQAGRAVALPRAALHPGLARRYGPVQAGAPRSRVGRSAAPGADGHLHAAVQQDRQRADGRGAVPGLRVRGAGPVDDVRERGGRLRRQPRRQPEPGVEGLLPEARHSPPQPCSPGSRTS